MERYLIKIIEEQITVEFTGKINILDGVNKQLLGFAVMLEGELIHVKYKNAKGMKAMASVIIDENIHTPLSFVVEPEIVGDIEKTIHFPFNKLKEKLAEIVAEYKEIEGQKPPKGIKLLINPQVLTSDVEISDTEFSLLCTISDLNKVEEIYQNSELMDYEITRNLVALRKKNALKVIGSK